VGNVVLHHTMDLGQQQYYQTGQPVMYVQQPVVQAVYTPTPVVMQPQPMVYQPSVAQSTTTQVVQNVPAPTQQTIIITQPAQVGSCDCGNPYTDCCCSVCCPCCDDIMQLSEAFYIIILVCSLVHPMVYWIAWPIVFYRTRALVRKANNPGTAILDQYKIFAICGWVGYGLSLSGYFFVLAWPLIIVSLLYGRWVYLSLRSYCGQIVVVQQGQGGTTTVVVQH